MHVYTFSVVIAVCGSVWQARPETGGRGRYIDVRSCFCGLPPRCSPAMAGLAGVAASAGAPSDSSPVCLPGCITQEDMHLESTWSRLGRWEPGSLWHVILIR